MQHSKTIAAGTNCSVFIDEEGKIFSFGKWQDRIEKITASHYFIRHQPRIAAVALGLDHALFLDESKQVWAMGNNAGVNWTYPGGVTWEQYIEQIEFLPPIIGVACGDNHSLLLDAEGNVWGCGQNESGELGDPTIPSGGKLFVKNSKLKHIQAIHCAGQYSLFLQATSGKVWISGSFPGVVDNQLVTIERIPRIKAISGGPRFYLLVDVTGKVWACGANENGQLGLGNKVEVAVPTRIPGLPPIRACHGGLNFSMFITEEDGTLWSVGNNSFGSLGNGKVGVGVITPAVVPGAPPVQAVSCGPTHSLFIDFQGGLWVCGEARKLPFTGGMQRYPTLTKVPFNTTVLECYSVGMPAIKSARYM